MLDLHHLAELLVLKEKSSSAAIISGFRLRRVLGILRTCTAHPVSDLTDYPDQLKVFL